MSKIVCCLFALAALMQTASALNCYTCGNTPCPPDSSHWDKVDCGKIVAQPDKQAGACLKTVYTDNATKKEITLRRCIIAEKAADGKLKFNCNESNGKVTSCDLCTTDLCNSAPAVKVGFVTLLGLIAAYVVPKYIM